MLFTRIPQQYAPLGGELRYTVTAAAAGTIDLRITDTGSADLIDIRIVDAAAGSAAGIGAAVSPGGADRAGTRGPVGDGSALLGAKRFAAVAEAAFDAAPYLRRRLHFTPATGRTGFYPAEGRTVTAVVEAAGTDGEAAAAARTFLPGDAPGTPGLRTSMPLVRLIPEDACDELTLLTDGPCIVTVTAEAGDTATAESYRASEAGLHLFRLDMRDFPGAERVTGDAGTCGTVVYSVTPAVQGQVRLAWRSSAGSVEHYTFPIVRTTTVRTERREAEGPQGRVVAAAETDREIVLVSAYETRSMLEPLAELTATAAAWIVTEKRYIPVDIATEEAVVQRRGTLSCLEIAIRPKRKKHAAWN